MKIKKIIKDIKEWIRRRRGKNCNGTGSKKPNRSVDI
jgi:hypothetical protein